ncbi:glycoside hydrolase family 3 protein [Microbacterium hydrocarbonoxydans]|uniref:glycoside hydrolase family 3 protein n=1 Tax=Microbacterium hydrocarbonoxydans TaxID=273678 RepID=UPI0013D9050A|nr:glycoside hydrolase family 3 protein [Microbacterium hydrocarbonoxydans]
MADYLDPALPVERRVEDLLSRMTVAEKAALMFHPSTQPGDTPDAPAALAAAEEDVVNRGITHFNVLGGEDSAAVARWHNTIQEMAESTRLGIPITLSSDPRHGFRDNPFTGQALDSLSRWPETTGIAAIGTAEAARAYGEAIRREFLAMGIRVYLGPMADIFSEPRWSRGFGTWGEDPSRVAEFTVAFIEALRGGPELGAGSVAAVVKHFPGGGPQLRGDDAHDPRYPEQVYPGGRQELHIEPFVKAFAAGATQVMTYYGKPVGTDWPEVGFAFSEPVVRDILRRRLGFDGIVVTDWNLLESTPMGDIEFGPNGWGLEDRTAVERAGIALAVGVDQFGGDRNPALIEELVDSGQIAESRLDESVRRLLREKFRLGAFEHRRVDVDTAGAICGAPELLEAGRQAQRDSLVLISQKDPAPIAPTARLFLDGLTAAGAGLPNEIVDDPSQADAIVVRRDAPYEEGRGSLGDFFRGGSLEFSPAELAQLKAYAAIAPVHVAVFLERPAVLAPLVDIATSVVGDFGASDAVVLDALSGMAPFTGTLPFDIPSSMAAVEASREDVPFDTAEPSFRFGHGIRTGASVAV